MGVLNRALHSGLAAIGALTPLKRPVLLISMPRSGSTWIGEILGSAEEALYLHEPVTQSFKRHVTRRGPAFFAFDACKNKDAYLHFASLSFQGIPNFGRKIVRYPGQWSLSGRDDKRTVIKEVNPLALDIFVEKFQPKVIYLIRHPVSVARSMHRKGWTGGFRHRFTNQAIAELKNKFSVPLEANFWEQSGSLQAIAHHLAGNSLRSSEHILVRYEDVCSDPLGEFSRLFEFCGFTLSRAIKDGIKISGRPNLFGAGDDREVALVRRGYFSNQPPFYAEDAWWPKD